MFNFRIHAMCHVTELMWLFYTHLSIAYIRQSGPSGSLIERLIHPFLLAAPDVFVLVTSVLFVMCDSVSSKPCIMALCSEREKTALLTPLSSLLKQKNKTKTTQITPNLQNCKYPDFKDNQTTI